MSFFCGMSRVRKSWKENEGFCPFSSKGAFQKEIINSFSNHKSSGDISTVSVQLCFGMSTRKRSNKEKRHLIKISAAFFFTFSPWGRNLETANLVSGFVFCR